MPDLLQYTSGSPSPNLFYCFGIIEQIFDLLSEWEQTLNLLVFKKRLKVNTSIRPLHLNGKGETVTTQVKTLTTKTMEYVSTGLKPSIPRHPVIPAEGVFLGRFLGSKYISKGGVWMSRASFWIWFPYQVIQFVAKLDPWLLEVT